MSTAEAEVFVPYSRRAPDTDDPQLLRAEHRLQIELHGRRSSEAAESFEHLLRASCKKGHPLDALNIHSRNEVERFFAQTVPGVDGHVYWAGAKHGFVRNDGKCRVPRRWWWGHKHGRELNPMVDLITTCGEPNCITPEHCELAPELRRQRRRFPDEKMLGALQVGAMRLGHTPSAPEWRDLGLHPSFTVYKQRFGSWGAAIEAAGLTYSHVGGRLTNADHCLSAVRAAHRFLGRWPSAEEFRSPPVRAHLRAAGLPTSQNAIRRHLGHWPDVIAKASRNER